jgi:hypothetical protein
MAAAYYLTNRYTPLRLQDLLSLFYLSAPIFRESLSRSIKEELHHSDGGANSLWTYFFCRHDASNCFGVLGIQASGRISRNCFYLPAPFSACSFSMGFRLFRMFFQRLVFCLDHVTFSFSNRTIRPVVHRLRLIFCYQTHDSSPVISNLPYLAKTLFGDKPLIFD